MTTDNRTHLPAQTPDSGTLSARDIAGSSFTYYPGIARAFTVAFDGNEVEQATILLSYFVHWTGRGRNQDGWIYKTGDDLADQTGLSRGKVTRRPMQLLQGMGLLEK